MGKYWVKWKSDVVRSIGMEKWVPIYTKDGPFETVEEALSYAEDCTNGDQVEIIWD